MSYMLAAVIIGPSAVTTAQYGPFTEKTSCQKAAREMVTGGIELTETDDMLTATIRVDTPAMAFVVFRYRLNCVRQ